MTSTLLIIQFVLAVVITVTVLLQKSSSMGLGAYSGSNETMFGAKGPGGFLAKLTFFFGTLFVLNTLTLGYLYNQEASKSVLDNVETNLLAPSAPVAPVQDTTVPTIPTVPAAK